MKKYFILILGLAFFLLSQAQTFFEVHNLTSKGMSVTIEEVSSQVYLAPVGSTTAPSFSRQIFSVLSLSQVTLRLAYDGQIRTIERPIYGGRVNIRDIDTRSPAVTNSSSTNFKEGKGRSASIYETGHFVKVFNLTGYKLFGMTDQAKGYILDPGGVTDTVGNKHYIVSYNLGISYNPLQVQFLDRQGTVIKDTVFLARILNLAMSSSIMINLWLPDGPLNFNFRYQDGVSFQPKIIVV
jgi:hypothetical protein